MKPYQYNGAMLCECCDKLAARNPADYVHRRKMMQREPGIDISACEYCGSKDWATTDCLVDWEAETGAAVSESLRSMTLVALRGPPSASPSGTS